LCLQVGIMPLDNLKMVYRINIYLLLSLFLKQYRELSSIFHISYPEFSIHIVFNNIFCNVEPQA